MSNPVLEKSKQISESRTLKTTTQLINCYTVTLYEEVVFRFPYLAKS